MRMETFGYARITLLPLAATLLLALILVADGSTLAGPEQISAEQPPRSGIGIGGMVGFWVDGVAPDSPAAAAGLQRGDVIVSIGEVPLDHSLRLRQVIGDAPPGTSFELHVQRYNPQTGRWQHKTVPVTSAPFSTGMLPQN